MMWASAAQVVKSRALAFGFLLAAFVAVSLLAAGPAQAATITVNTNLDDANNTGNCTLREAITASNTNAAVDACASGAAGADTINFASGIGTITLTATGAGENNNVSGDLDITDDLTINGGSGVIIEGGPVLNERVIDIPANPTTGAAAAVTITDATIRKGNAIFAPNESSSFGGGIRVNGKAPPVDNGAALTLRRSTVTDNHADQNGGGIYDEFRSDITLEDSTVSTSTAGDTGGIHVRGTLTMVNSTVSGNEGGGLGGGISAGGGTTVTMTGSTMSGNTANNEAGGSDGNGGGIYMSGATVTLTDSTVSSNTSEGGSSNRGLGGGIYEDSGTLTLANTTVSGNTAQSGSDANADGEGGGIYKLSGATTLSNSTVAFNTAGAAETGGDGGGVFSTSMGSFTFRNSILALNNADLSADLAGTFASEGYNLLGENPGPLAPTDIVDPNPLLGPLADNGGATLTHALQTGSPAIDAANPAAPGSGGTACEATDQRNEARPQDGDGDATATCDIGAFEKAGGGGGGDTTPPEVFNVSPTGTGIPRTTNVTITFSEAMDTSTFDADTVKLTQGSTSIPFTMTTSTDGSGRTVLTLNPFGSTTQKLGRKKTYTVTVEGTNPAGDSFAVRDATGNELTQDHVSTFRTKRR